MRCPGATTNIPTLPSDLVVFPPPTERRPTIASAHSVQTIHALEIQIWTMASILPTPVPFERFSFSFSVCVRGVCILYVCVCCTGTLHNIAAARSCRACGLSASGNPERPLQARALTPPQHTRAAYPQPTALPRVRHWSGLSLAALKARPHHANPNCRYAHDLVDTSPAAVLRWILDHSLVLRGPGFIRVGRGSGVFDLAGHRRRVARP
jgi:hypothetical protein